MLADLVYYGYERTDWVDFIIVYQFSEFRVRRLLVYARVFVFVCFSFSVHICRVLLLCASINEQCRNRKLILCISMRGKYRLIFTIIMRRKKSDRDTERGIGKIQNMKGRNKNTQKGKERETQRKTERERE